MAVAGPSLLLRDGRVGAGKGVRLQPQHVSALRVGVDLQPWSMGCHSLHVVCVVSWPRS
jgi:hypothetical protein